MKQKLLFITFLLFLFTTIFGQAIKRIDGSTISVDSLQQKIEHLMKVANVSGLGISVFNNNKPVFSNTFGLANVQNKEPFQANISSICLFAGEKCICLYCYAVSAGRQTQFRQTPG